MRIETPCHSSNDWSGKICVDLQFYSISTQGQSAVQDTAKDEVQKALYGLLADNWQEVAQHQIKWKILLSEATGSQLIAAPF